MLELNWVKKMKRLEIVKGQGRILGIPQIYTMLIMMPA